MRSMLETQVAQPRRKLGPTDQIAVRFTDGQFCFLAGHLWPFPTFKNIIKEGGPDAGVAIDLSSAEFLAAFSHIVGGGEPARSCLRVYPKLGIKLKDEWLERFLGPVDDAIVSKSGQMPLMGLLARGAADAALDATRSPFAVTYGEMFPSTLENEPPNGQAYVRSTCSVERSAGGSGRYRFDIPHDADLVDTWALKVLLPALPPGGRWRTDVDVALLRRVTVTCGGTTEQELLGTINHALAHAKNLWPALANRYRDEPLKYREARSARSWLLTIPLMLSDSCETRRAFPMAATAFHDTTVGVELASLGSLVEGIAPGADVAPIDVLLDVDKTHLDTAIRATIATGQVGRRAPPSPPAKRCAPDDPAAVTVNEDEMNDFVALGPRMEERGGCAGSPATIDAASFLPSPRPTSVAEPSRHQILRQVQSETHSSMPERLPLNFSHPVTGLIVMLRCNRGNATHIVPPLRSLSLHCNNHLFQIYDVKDLLDWNWRKCGTAPPPPSQDGTFTLLFPFGTDMFHNRFPCTLNLSRLDSVWLRFDVHPDFERSDWETEVHALSYNMRIFSGGLCAPKFSC